MRVGKEKCCAVNREAISKINNGRNHEVNHAKRQTDVIDKMIMVRGESFLMGTNEEDVFPADGEGPARQVTVDDFYIDQHTVTNREFQLFIKDTNYKTDAEHFGWSFVFQYFLSSYISKKVTQRVQQTPWWVVVEGAYWKQPEGPDSQINDRMDHPVVHISWHDALAYCRWAGKRLPTEAEWEFAARGGLEQNRYPWGNELTPTGRYYCNIWQGTFPHINTKEDGFVGTAPAISFPQNGYGLYNMAGNVWEWCADWFSKDHDLNFERYNPIGPKTGKSRVMRGGSYLCHEQYCDRYRVAARTANTPDSSSGNVGFRCVRDC